MRSKIVAPLIAMVVAAQACCCCTLLGGPQPPYVITPSDEAARCFQERMDSVERNADGTFSITITEEEITSLIVQQMEQQSNPPPISQPQVHFRDGRVEFYGTVTLAGNFALPGLIAFSIDVPESELAITIEEIALGPLPISESALESFTQVLNEALTENITIDDRPATITNVQVGDGQMTVTGKPQSE